MSYTNLFAGDTAGVGGTNTNTVVAVGPTGARAVNIASGSLNTALNLGNEVDTVTLTGSSSTAFTVRQAGTNIVITDTLGNSYTMSLTSVADTLTFANGSLTVGLVGNNVVLNNGLIGGTQTLTNGGAAVAVLTPSGGGGGTTYDLTTGADLLVGDGSDNVFAAPIKTIPATGALGDTAQSVDIIDGGAGNDTINIQTQGGGTLGISLTSVETVNYTSFAANTYNMANSTGVTAFNNKNSIDNVTLTNAKSIFDLGVSSVSGNKTDISYATAATSSSADTQKIVLNGATNDHTITFNDAAIEKYAITSSGSANKIKLDDIGTAVKTITVDGDQALTLAFLDTAGSIDAITSFDGSTATGAIKADLLNNVDASDMVVKTGSGNDTVTFGKLTKNDSIDLGTGTDTLKLYMTAALTTPAPITGVEALTLTANGNYALNLSGVTDLTTVNLGVEAAQRTFTLSNLNSSVTTLNLNGGGATVDATVDNISLGLKTSTGTADALAVNLSNVDANGNVVVPGKGVQLSSTLTANGIENLTIDSAQLGADTNATTQDGGYALDITDDKLQTLTLKSPTLLDLNGTALSSTLKTVAASEANGGVLLDMSNAADSTTTAAGGTGSLSVTTGSGADTIANLLGTVATTVSTGDGNDTISLKAASTISATVTIDAGNGNDSIDVSGTATTNKAINITTGDGVDTVKLLGLKTQADVTIGDLTVGSGGDKLAFGTLNVVGMDSPNDLAYFTDHSAGVAIVLDDGLNIASGVTAASLSTTDVAAALATAKITDANTSNDANYIIVSNGTDAGLYAFVGAAGSSAIASTELTQIATLTGVSDTSLLTADNFTQFLG